MKSTLQLFRIALATALMILVVLVLANLMDSRIGARLTAHGGFLDSGSDSLYFLTFMAGIALIVFNKSLLQRKGWLVLMVPFAGVFLLLEESGFGRAYGMPFSGPVIYGKKMDSFHDLIEAFANMAAIHPLQASIVTGIILLSTVILVYLAFKNIQWVKEKSAIFLEKHPAVLYYMTAFVMLLTAQLIDIGLISLHFYYEEVLEFTGAVMVFFSLFTIMETSAPPVAILNRNTARQQHDVVMEKS